MILTRGSTSHIRVQNVCRIVCAENSGSSSGSLSSCFALAVSSLLIMNLNKELHNDITRLLKEKVCKGPLPNWNKDRKEIVFIATELCNHLAMEAFSCDDPQKKTNTFVLGKLFDFGSLTQCAFDEYLRLCNTLWGTMMPKPLWTSIRMSTRSLLSRQCPVLLGKSI